MKKADGTNQKVRQKHIQKKLTITLKGEGTPKQQEIQGEKSERSINGGTQ